jgi:very-short-patch-repair endonuclease
MGDRTAQSMHRRLWKLAERQHGVVARSQLLELGFTPKAIKHRVARGRLHPVWRGVYAVGRPELTRQGRWMGAVLACGPGALLSHEDAGVLWEMRPLRASDIHVSVSLPRCPRQRGIVIHRRMLAPGDVIRRYGIPVTTPIATIIDLATCLDRDRLEGAINEADKRDLVHPDELRRALDESPSRPGVGVLRRTLDRRTFTLSDSQLERRFKPIARRAGLPKPQTQQWVNGFKVDFYWPALALVVETDGLRFHRTPAEQARDRLRDQEHAAAGLTPLRFTRAQVRYDPLHVEKTLTAVATRLRGAAAAA